MASPPSPLSITVPSYQALDRARNANSKATEFADENEDLRGQLAEAENTECKLRRALPTANAYEDDATTKYKDQYYQVTLLAQECQDLRQNRELLADKISRTTSARYRSQVADSQITVVRLQNSMPDLTTMDGWKADFRHERKAWGDATSNLCQTEQY